MNIPSNMASNIAILSGNSTTRIPEYILHQIVDHVRRPSTVGALRRIRSCRSPPGPTRSTRNDSAVRRRLVFNFAEGINYLRQYEAEAAKKREEEEHAATVAMLIQELAAIKMVSGKVYTIGSEEDSGGNGR